MAKAIWNGKVLAESDRYKVVDGDIYFPPEAVKWGYFKQGDTEKLIPDKGRATFLDVEVKGKVNRNVAWSYPDPVAPAKSIASHVAFADVVDIKV